MRERQAPKTMPTRSCGHRALLCGERLSEKVASTGEQSGETVGEHPRTWFASLMHPGLEPAAPLDFQVYEQFNSLFFCLL